MQKQQQGKKRKIKLRIRKEKYEYNTNIKIKRKKVFMKQNGHTIKVRNLRLSSQEMKPMTSPTQVFVE